MMNHVRQQLKTKRGMDLPAHLPPRAMASSIRTQWSDASSAPLLQWLLRVEQARYAPHPDAALADLQRELRQLQWPTANAN